MTFGITAGGWHNPHVQYAPVGYSLNASNYCLGCIAAIALSDMNDKLPRGCACTECVLDMWAAFNGIKDRMDERSFDSSSFPKSIAYHDACQQGCEDMGCERTDDHEHHEMCEGCGSDICAT